MNSLIHKNAHWLLLLLLVAIWGSSFILMKRTLDFYSASELGAIRLAFAAIVLLPLAIIKSRKLSVNQWFWIIAIAVIGNTFPVFLIAKAQTVIDSSLAGILNSTTPMFTLVVGLGFFGLRANRLNFIGILIGLFGVIMIILVKNEGQINFNLQYSAYVIIATICYAFNINFVKYKLADTDALTIAALSYSVLLLPILLFLFFCTDFSQSITQLGAVNALIYPAILGILGSAIAIIIFNYLLKIAGVLFTSSVTYLIPVVASIIGFADGEIFKASYLIWIGLILFGVFLVNRKK